MKQPQRVALIAGSSRGIGAGVAQYLINKGYFAHCTYLKDRDLYRKLKAIEKEFHPVREIVLDRHM